MREVPDSDRRRADAKLVVAHERVLDRWPDDRVEELADPVEAEPAYRPLKPSPVEAAFYYERKREMADVEVERVTETYGDRYRSKSIVVGWRAVE